VIYRVLISTRSKAIYLAARRLSQAMLSCLFPISSSSDEKNKCRNHELLCWLDGLTEQALDEFVTLVQEASERMLDAKVMFAEQCRSYVATTVSNSLPCTPILAHAISTFGKLSRALQFLTCQVATKLLLYSSDPLAMALVWSHLQKSLAAQPMQLCPQIEPVFQSLSHYARCITVEDFGEYQDSLNAVLSSVFVRSYLSRTTVSDGTTPDENHAVARVEFVAEDSDSWIRERSHQLLIANDEDVPRLADEMKLGLMVALVVSLSNLNNV
jgi:hypothetical protein